MWTAVDTAHALRGQKNHIRDAYLTEARAKLWHLDRRVFARRGVVLACIQNTQAVLQQSCDHFVEREMSSPPTLSSSADSTADQMTQFGAGCEPQWRECAAEWAALPFAYTDILVMHRILTASVCQALAEQGADKNALGLVVGILATITAMTAERRIADMEQQADARREEQMVTQHLAGRFLANASHELRTPLTAVMGFADLLLEETYGPLNEEQRKAIGHIENSAQNLLEIANNLLDLLKVRAGELKMLYRQVAIAPLLRDLHRILTPLAERKKVRFTIDVSDTLGMIEADENIIRHIVYHLLTSSLRATPADGSVAVSAERGPETVTIHIRDTALHLPPEAIANMADPFPRLENSPARGYEGWEVGLPLVRRYIDMHGGKLEIESQQERGTLFLIVLHIVAGGSRPTPSSAA